MLIDEVRDGAAIAGVCLCSAARGRTFSRMNQSFRTVDMPTGCRIYVTEQPLVIHGTARDPDWVEVASMSWLRSYLGAPICLLWDLVPDQLGGNAPVLFGLMSG